MVPIQEYFIKANSQKDKSIEEGIQGINKIIDSQLDKEIKLFVDENDATSQITTIYVLDNLIDFLKYTGIVEVIYKPGNKDSGLTIDKLALLIPGLDPKNPPTDPKNPLIYETDQNKCGLIFREYGPSLTSPAKEPICLAFTGGDSSKEDPVEFTRKLGATFYLRLQPANSKNPQLLIDAVGKKSYDLKDTKFNSYLYYISDVKEYNPSNPAWKWYESNGGCEKATNLAQYIVNQLKLKDNTIQLWPIYVTEDIDKFIKISNLLCYISGVGLHLQQDDLYKFKKPILILSLGKVDEKQLKDYQNLLANGLVTFEKDALKIINNTFTLTSLREKFMSLVSDIEPRGNFLTSLNATKRIETIQIEDLDSKTLLEKLQNLNKKTEEILILHLGNIPFFVFRLLFSMANIPSIFNENYTSISLSDLPLNHRQEPNTLADNQGKVFIRLKYNPFNTVNPFNKVNSYFEQVLKAFCFGPTDIITPGLFETSVTKTSLLINDSFNSESDLSKEFQKKRDDCHKEGKNRLLHSIVYLNSILKESSLSSRSSLINTNNALLEQLYQALQNNLLPDGTLDLIPKSLPPGPIFDFYKSLSSSNRVKLKAAKINAIRDPSQQIIGIDVSGNTNDFTSNFTMQIKFTEEYNQLVSEAVFSSSESLSLLGMPWIALENIGFKLNISDNNLPCTVSFFGTVHGTSLVLSISSLTSTDWLIDASFEEGHYPSIASVYSLTGGVNLVQTLPPPLNAIVDFGVKEIQGAYDIDQNVLEYLLFVFSTQQSWQLVPGIEIKGIEVKVVIQSPIDLVNRTTMAIITGYFKIAEGTISISTTIPGFAVTGGLTDGQIQLQDLIALFLPDVQLDLDAAITNFNFSANPNEGSYSVDCGIETDWNITTGGITFALNNLGFSITSVQKENWGSISALTAIGPDDNLFEIRLCAIYLGSDLGWQFEGNQEETNVFSLGKLMKKYLGWDISENYGITGLGFMIQPKTRSYSLKGKTAEPWKIPFLSGQSPDISADFLIRYVDGSSDPKQNGYYGQISAEIQYYFIDITIFYNFDPMVQSFCLTWGDFQGIVAQDEKSHWIGTLHLNHFNLGDMVETFVEWATGQKFGLSSPWDFLSHINLDTFTLKFNFTTKQVVMDYQIGPIDLGFAKLDTISLTYDPTGPNKGVHVSITGSFFWQENPNEPLHWDATKPETTPAPPGGGNKFIDLRMLALGQHISIEGYSSFKSVEQAIKAMRDLSVPEPGKIPVGPSEAKVEECALTK